jgi:hypothetical protein
MACMLVDSTIVLASSYDTMMYVQMYDTFLYLIFLVRAGGVAGAMLVLARCCTIRYVRTATATNDTATATVYVLSAIYASCSLLYVS